MKRLLRLAIDGLTVLSLVVCVASVVLWVRSSTDAGRKLDDSYYVAVPIREVYGLVLSLASLLPMWQLLRWLSASRSAKAVANGQCPTCGYDLRATPERCPECGTVPGRAGA